MDLSYWSIEQQSGVHHLRTTNGITDCPLRELGEEEKKFSTEFIGKEEKSPEAFVVHSTLNSSSNKTSEVLEL